MTPVQYPLTGKRILVPPARPEANPLRRMLKKKGAEVLEFPTLRPAPPLHYHAMDQAIQQLQGFDWIIFSGSNCVVNFFDRMDTLGLGKEAITEARIGAIGQGAFSALKKLGIGVDYVPKVHTAKGVTSELGDIQGSNLLLVRIDEASRDLPDRLGHLGARVTEVVGYRMILEANVQTAERVLGEKLHALALANPTAVRFLVKATDNLGINLQSHLKGVPIAAVGPTTAEAARSQGYTPDIVSGGHIANLTETLVQFLSR